MKIGKNFTLQENLASQTTAVLGIRGSGKTVTASVITEELLSKGHQVVIIDPTDVWWGLRSTADGKKGAHNILVLGGDHADLPLVETDGATVADFVVTERASCILSLRHMRKAAQRRFVTDYAEQLYFRKGKHRDPLLQIIDECDAFIPQHVGGGDARMVGAIEDLVRRGRAAGLGVLLISQRAASVNKDVLTQIETLVAHRHTSPQDRKALLEWVQAHDSEDRQKQFMASLASLKQGQAWFWSPLLDIFENVQVRQRHTFDSSATPKHGKVKTPRNRAVIDVEAWRSKLGAMIDRKKAEDPNALRNRVAELEKQLQKAQATPQKPVTTGWQITPQVIKAINDADQQNQTALDRWIKDIRKSPVEQVLHVLNKPVRLHKVKLPGHTHAPAPVLRVVHRKADLADPTISATYGNDSKLGKCERAIYSFLASNPSRSWSREQVGIMTGYSPQSGSFSNSLSALSSQSLISRMPDGRLQANLVEGVPVDSVDFSLQNIYKLLGKCEREILGVVRDVRETMTKEDLAGLTPSRYSANSGSFNNSISRLVTLGLLERRGGSVQRSQHLEDLL